MGPAIEIEEMAYLKITAVPVIVEELRMMKKETDKDIYKIPGSQSLHEIKNTFSKKCIS